MKLWKQSVLFGLLALSLFFALIFLYTIPVKMVTFVSPCYYINTDELKNMLLSKLNKGYLVTPLAPIKDSLQAYPWINEVTVSRKWPWSIDIALTEYQAVARWKDEGVVSRCAKVFYPNWQDVPADLPVFVGELHQLGLLSDIYALLQQKLSALGYRVYKIEVMLDRGVKVILDDGLTVLLGRENHAGRVKLLAKVLKPGSKIVKKGQKIASLDLRYLDGLAVTWKS